MDLNLVNIANVLEFFYMLSICLSGVKEKRCMFKVWSALFSPTDKPKFPFVANASSKKRPKISNENFTLDLIPLKWMFLFVCFWCLTRLHCHRTGAWPISDAAMQSWTTNHRPNILYFNSKGFALRSFALRFYCGHVTQIRLEPPLKNLHITHIRPGVFICVIMILWIGDY